MVFTDEVAVLDWLKVLNFLAILASFFDDARHVLVVEVNLIPAKDVGEPGLLVLQENLAILVGALHVLENDAGPSAIFYDIVHPVDRLAGRQVGLSLNTRRADLVLFDLVEDGLAIGSIIIVTAFNPAANSDAERICELESTATGRAHPTHVRTDILSHLIDTEDSRVCLSSLGDNLRHLTAPHACSRGHSLLVCVRVIDVPVHHVRDGVEDDETALSQLSENVHCTERQVDNVLQNGGLGNCQVVDINAKLIHVRGVKRVFGIDIDNRNALLLSMADREETLCCLAGRFLAEDFADTTSRPTTHADSHV